MDADVALADSMGERTPESDPFAEKLAAETPRVRAWLARLIRRADVDDLVQETLTRAWRYRSAFDEGKELGPWLRGTALRVALDHRARLQREIPTSSLDDASAVQPAAAHADHEALDANEVIDALLARLDATERDVLVRFHRLGQSIAEIASTLRLPAGTVKSHLHRARRKLAGTARREGLE